MGYMKGFRSAICAPFPVKFVQNPYGKTGGYSVGGEGATVMLASSWSSNSPAKVAVRRHHGGLAGGGEVVGDDVRHLRPQMGFGVPTFSRLACPSNWDHT